jgi:DNA modification methylase
MTLFNKFKRNLKKFNDYKFKKEKPENSETNISTKKELNYLQNRFFL